MATADELTPNIDNAISKATGLATEASKKPVDIGPIYKMMPNTKIPVSKNEAGLWKARRDAGKQAISTIVSQWKEAMAYYSLGQDVHRQDEGGETSGNERQARNKGRRYSSTENVVYSNVNAIVPAIIAKNPQSEVTSFLKQLAPQATMFEHLINRLAQMKYAPGLNLKPKLRKCILRCEIMNEAWVMVGYTKKEDSAEQARADLIKIGDELAKESTDVKKIKELEGQLMAIEELVDVLNPSGPFVRTLSADKVYVDPTSTEDDFSDANWMMAEVMMPTAYLLAKYSEKNEVGEYVAVYNDKYIINPGNTGNTNLDEMNNVRLLTEGDGYRGSGFESEESYKKAVLSKVWYCFDKVKRRFMLIADENWKWPLWVYDDPYQLPCFFPLKRLQFHSDPVRNRTKGEVSHYLDQQDEINDINTEIHWMRTQLKTKVVYNANYLDKDQVDNLMKGVDRQAVGVKGLPEGQKLSDVIMAPPLPNLQYKELFSKDALYAAIDRIGTANDVIRGAQFKTNTTNDAIGTYNSIQNQRLDEKIDSIEDFSGDIFYDIMFLCAQFMSQEEVQYILGDESQDWIQMSPENIRTQFACTVLGGSTQKPTSAVKKEQALKISQVLGQFANASPEVVITILEVLEKAFDDIVIDADDWERIKQSIQMKLQQGSPQQAPVNGTSQVSQPSNRQAPLEANDTGEQEPPGPNNPIPDHQTPPPPVNHAEQMQLEMAIKKLPPQAQQAIKSAQAKGVPQQQAYVEVMKHLQSNPPVSAPTTTH